MKPAVKDLLKRLLFRRSLGTSYLVQAGRGREALVVPTMMTDRHLERLCAYSRATIREAVREGYVTITEGNGEELPFGYRDRLDARYGDPIHLTDKGREAIEPKGTTQS